MDWNGLEWVGMGRGDGYFDGLEIVGMGSSDLSQGGIYFLVDWNDMRE